MSRNTITTIVGRKGCGKSTLVRELIAGERRLVIFDTLGEYGERDQVTIASGFAEGMAALQAAGRSDQFRISLRLEEDRHAHAAARVLWEFRRVLIVVEEASAYLRPSHLPAPFKKLVRMGRHRGISQIYVAQRPAMLNRDVTSQSDVIVTFQQHGSRDLEYLRDVFGDEAELARALEPFAIMAAGPGLARAHRAIRSRLRAR